MGGGGNFMLIKESQLNTTQNPYRLLESIDYISDNISPAMVPVIESSRLNGYIINLDDIRTFGESSGIEDLGQCFGLICEANQIDESKVRFSVDGYKLLEDDSLTDIVAALISEGVEVVQKPLIETNPALILAEKAIYDYSDTGDWLFFESFLNDDFIILEEKLTAAQKRGRKIERKIKHAERLHTLGKLNTQQYYDLRGQAAPASGPLKNKTQSSINRQIKTAIGYDEIFGNDALRNKGTLKRSMIGFVRKGMHPSVRDAIHQVNVSRRVGSLDSGTHKNIISALSNLNNELSKQDDGSKMKAKEIMKDLEDKHGIYFDHPDIVTKDRNSQKQQADAYLKKQNNVFMGLNKFDKDSPVNEKDEKWQELHKLEKATAKDQRRMKTMERIATSQIADRAHAKLRTAENMLKDYPSEIKLDVNDRNEFEKIQKRLTSGDYVNQNEYGKLNKRLNKLIATMDSQHKAAKAKAKSVSDTINGTEQSKDSEGTKTIQNTHNNNNDQVPSTQPKEESKLNDKTDLVEIQTNQQEKEKINKFVIKIEREAEQKPKSWLAQKIYALRQLYAKWLKKKNEEKDQGKIGFFSNILRLITKGIDFLLKKLQNFVD